MALDTYRRKRDFKTTPEPQGKVAHSATGQSFVIQKHAARRLHYDFRLEMDGVLKSWAVTRGPSLVPGEKRLAVHVEDHPLDYSDFEGTIPKGEYGGGTVLLWDRGTWAPIGDAHKGYAKGHLEFTLDGEKLHGRWHLVRMHRKERDRHENWLLIKGEDEEARGPEDPDILEEHPESVSTGRDIPEIAGEAPGWSSKTGRIAKPQDDPPAGTGKAKPGAKAEAGKAEAGRGKTGKGKARQAKPTMSRGLPAFVEPELATLVPHAPKGKGWVHEIKYDGYRLIARIADGGVKLLTRTGLDWTDRFGPEVVAALGSLPLVSALIDGELIVENDAGASDFSALQAELSAGRSDRFLYVAFDLLFVDGVDLRERPLLERKTKLQDLLAEAGPRLRYSEHFAESGELVLRHACRLSLEGVVSKEGGSPYVSGRGRDWQKSKCSHRQEFVIGGYLPSSVSPTAIGSLALGAFEDGRLIHLGRVGTGFSDAVAKALFIRLEGLRTPRSPFAGKLTADEARGLRYVKPELVAEVEFRGWTADHNLRHAAFRGLREDKPAPEVVRETEAEHVSKSDGGAAKPKANKPLVKLTHPDRVYWPDVGVTKQGLADYVSEVWRRMGPYVAGRPLSLVRCPGGVTEACFFQKHAWQGASKAIRQAPDPGDPQAEPLLVVDDLAGALALVQAGVLEIHPWGSTLADIERPDLLILDLDPGEGVPWSAVIAAAHEARDRFAEAGLTSFVKTSGGKGLHVVASVKPSAAWPEAKAFTKAIADAMSADSPDKYLAVVSKAKRKGKILVDYLRNGRGATAVAPYSTRSRPGAPVSMPLDWSELGEAIGPAYFTVANTPARLARQETDPWADFRRAAAPLGAGKKTSAGKARKAG
jgi:bifunctional non-homologous end joining protein LigD